ncbi:subtilisin-like protease SBT4.3 [Apium graveolens]|uniref:subtilisin-like protease SBT4.3 n=1 Tax=Apium graveolens TaxID=4045 RepID=UPI003D79E8EE
MANLCSISLSFLLFFVYVVHGYRDGDQQKKQVYIVYMGALPDGTYSPSSHHSSILEEVVGDRDLAESSLLTSYGRSFNGFSAYLTDQERQKIAQHEAVVSVFRSRKVQIQTTRSWDFMGLSENVHRIPSQESDVIVGVIDTGIWPESESFDDKNFGPVPSKWKGACMGGKNFTCNKKLIGARYYTNFTEYMKPFDSARDRSGHGTFTASVAAGNYVRGASFYGLAQGTARGGVPSARIAAYRACDDNGFSSDANILGAFDDAIADGVDILSVSLGIAFAFDISTNSISIGAFHASEKGILTVAAGGNVGTLGSVDNVSPWMLTVAASSIDRQIISKLVLGDGRTLIGPVVNSLNLTGSYFPLISGLEGTKTCKGEDAKRCASGCLDSELVKGKIIVCRDNSNALDEASRAGSLGSVVYNDVPYYNYSDIYPIPTSFLSTDDFSLVEDYLNSTKEPRANILKSEVIHNSEAPVVASLSSRGPNLQISEILKPDITAPGLSILAAFSPASSPSGSPNDKRSVKYVIMSGTSVATPHAAGAAAYVKSLHPEWSASAIQSSLMTTAWHMDASANPDAEFAYGAGHLNPVNATNPGLVYETTKQEYLRMLCSMGFNISKIRNLSGDKNTSCPAADTFTPKDLNYPTMAVNVTKNKPFTVSFPRTVTNVGLPNSTYKAYITSETALGVSVKPRILPFKSLNEKKSFVVVVTGKGLQENTKLSASLVWTDGIHSVRSPIVVYSFNSTSLA